KSKYQEAVIEYRNAVQIDPRFAAAHRELAKSYLALQNRDSAFREFTAAAGLDPADKDSILGLARLQIDRGMYKEAQAALQKILTADPKNVEAHAALGQKDIATHDEPEAIEELRKVVELDPARAASYAALGAAYMASGDAARAEDAYKRAAA